jgi:ABC-2 type transport system permease protein
MPGVDLVSVQADVESARQALRDQAVDVVIVAPSDLQANFEAGRQSTILVEYNIVSPVKANYALVLAQQLAYGVNQQIIERAAAKGVSEVGTLGRTSPIPPAVIAAPTRADPHNLAPVDPSLTSFFGPAVLALILQHMAVTLTALSLVRERHTGVFDVLRVSPVSAVEIILGKLVAFAILGAGMSVVILGLLVYAFHAPFLGDAGLVGITIGLVLAASLGIGLLISVISDSERQAVQLALLVLLGSVFFSGFILDVQQFIPAVQVIGDLLPVTHGIRLLQDLMLRGATTESWRLSALLVIALVTLATTWGFLRRGLSARA